MKKSIVSLMCLFVFAACKKETELEKYNKDIIGLWIHSGNLIKYYDNTGAQIYQEELKAEGTFKNIEFRSNLTVTASITNAESYFSKYDLIDYENKKFVEFYSLALFNAQYFQILSKTASEMVWKTKFTNIEFFDEDIEDNVVADYAILTINLVKN